jgi:ethanolamine utilization microcompartment shell protein EutS
MAQAIELRTYSFIDSLQPQMASFIATVARGFLPLERQAALFVEIEPALAVNSLLDVALKRTAVIPGMQVIERAYGMIEVHHADQGQVHEAGRAILEYLGMKESDRLTPRIVSHQMITGMENHQTHLINRMRHGQFLLENETLYILEVHPAGYAAIAANEAEKAASVNLLEVETFGAFGRLYLGGSEENIREAAAAIEKTLSFIKGRENPGQSLVY